MLHCQGTVEENLVRKNFPLFSLRCLLGTQWSGDERTKSLYCRQRRSHFIGRLLSKREQRGIIPCNSKRIAGVIWWKWGQPFNIHVFNHSPSHCSYLTLTLITENLRQRVVTITISFVRATFIFNLDSQKILSKESDPLWLWGSISDYRHKFVSKYR